MKINFKVDKDSLGNWSKDNKEFLIPIIVFAASGFLLIVFILPNILSFPSKNSARNEEVEKLNEIKDAQVVVSTTNKEILDKELEISSMALPSEKNFELILGAISDAATRSDVQISGYQYEDVTDLVAIKGAETNLPSLKFNIQISGNVAQAANFAEALYETYPVSSIKSIEYSNGLATVIVEFYYKPFTSLSAENAAIARKKTLKEANTMNKIADWNKVNTDLSFDQLNPSTESAKPEEEN